MVESCARRGTTYARGMRRPALAFVVLVAGCGPKVSPAPVTYDEELAFAEVAGPGEPAPTTDLEARPVAAAGPGVRTGTIERASLIAVLDGGPAQFLKQFEVTAKLAGERFVGWQLVKVLDRSSPLAALDLAPGDVLLAVNGKPVSRPDELQTLWDSLRTANQVTANLWRGDAKVELAFSVEPQVSPSGPPAPTAPTPGR